MSSVLVVAPHPDDETLGCGGTLLRHVSMGDEVHWLLVTAMDAVRFAPARIEARRREIQAVSAAYRFASVIELGLPTARLDALPVDELVASIGKAVGAIKPDIVYLPFPGDAHTDHRTVFTAAIAATKWFRYPGVRRILACEIPSETDFGLAPDALPFRPNVYVDISSWLQTKLNIMRMYAGEMAEHPFPRSEDGLRALATLRGSQSGCEAAEAFMLLKELVR